MSTKMITIQPLPPSQYVVCPMCGNTMSPGNQGCIGGDQRRIPWGSDWINYPATASSAATRAATATFDRAAYITVSVPENNAQIAMTNS